MTATEFVKLWRDIALIHGATAYNLFNVKDRMCDKFREPVDNIDVLETARRSINDVILKPTN